MYSTRPGLILGFHGCDASVAKDVLLGKTFLRASTNNYDWLGHGIYFWEHSPSRAMEFAKYLQKHPSHSKGAIKEPAVIGAVIDLGTCCDLLDYQRLQLLKNGYRFVKKTTVVSEEIPQNRTVGNLGDLLLRELDCSVIEAVHKFKQKTGQSPFDSVRSVFYEGKELYPNAGFREKDHIQICIRNPNCIKGFFLPRAMDEAFLKV
ncbi:hypothetical protein SAMD00024442_62_2 [Candidatus Symbiothrix dinenymphae]|nr:hypothetical protein SAMD00024442_62_2 [Candidatus Symbiothrix dinenymphae]